MLDYLIKTLITITALLPLGVGVGLWIWELIEGYRQHFRQNTR